MHGAQEILTMLESDKLVSLEEDTGSKLNSSLPITSGKARYFRKKDKPNLKFSSTSVGSALLKRARTDCTKKKHIRRKNFLRSLGTKFSKKQASLKCQGKNSLVQSMENADEANRNCRTEKLTKRKVQKIKKDNVKLDDASRLKRRARYLLIKLKLEQNLIDAYLGEGWKGQSREKIRPEKELQRAKKQILRCKLGIRDAVRQLDSLSSVGCIEASVMSPDGSVYHEHIFCAKCKLGEALPDNDIILCDGTCNCAFHQKCLDPPLATENIPMGDQGWLCQFCECKMDILESVNAHLGTQFSVDTNWEEIFEKEAALPAGGTELLDPQDEWPSDDSEDDDYDPARNENSCSCSRAGSDHSVSDDTSSFSSLSWSLEENVFLESQKLAKRSNETNINSVDLVPTGDLDEITDHEIVNGRRKRRAVDYKLLYNEMFGNDDLAIEQVSEDEDWGPFKKKRTERESDAASTLMTLHESEDKCPNEESMEVQKRLPKEPRIKKRFLRIPPSAVEKLRCVFAENELPSRAVKETLSKQLGLEPEKVSKWFKNARYLALKTRKDESGKCHKSENDGTDPQERNDNLLTSDKAPKKLNMIGQGRNRKSHTSSTSRQYRGEEHGSSASGNKAMVEFHDDMSLKKQLKCLKEKINRERKSVNLKSRIIQQAESEMERLCQLKTRLEQLKQLLPSFQKKRTKKSNEQQFVMLVPIAELREKV